MNTVKAINHRDDIVSFIKSNGPVTRSELIDHADVDRSTLKTVVRCLLYQGVIVTTPAWEYEYSATGDNTNLQNPNEEPTDTVSSPCQSLTTEDGRSKSNE